MKKSLLLCLLIGCFSQFSASAQEQLNIEWGEMNKVSGYTAGIYATTSNKNFYKVSYEGSIFTRSAYINYYENFKLVSSNKIINRIGNSMASPETFRVINDEFYVFLSDKIDSQNKLYYQKYNKQSLPVGEPVEIISINFPKGIRNNPNYSFIQSDNNNFLCIEYTAPTEKNESPKYGYLVIDNEFKTVTEGIYESPYESRRSSFSSHYLSNSGEYFFACKVYATDDKNRVKNYASLEKMLLIQVNPDGLDEFELELDKKKIYDVSFSSDNNEIMTFTGLYGENTRGAGIKGIFYFRLDYEHKKIMDEGFEEFKKDFITEGWSEKQKEKADAKAAKGKGEPQFYNYDIRKTHTLSDGSIIGTLEQYYVREVTTRDPKTGATSTTYYYYYNDLIVYKIEPNGTFDWITKIPKTQVSTNDYGPMSSVAIYFDDENINLIFNDNIKNYDLINGQFIADKSTNSLYTTSFNKKYNCVAHAKIDIKDGSVERENMFDAKTLEVFAHPKKFVNNSENRNMLIYFRMKKNEKMGVLTY